jgi:hypothetical protein
MNEDFEDFMNEDFDHDVQHDIQVLKQVWSDMVEEKPLTPFVSKGQKKKNKKIARSTGQQYHTRSKGAPPHMSL